MTLKKRKTTLLNPWRNGDRIPSTAIAFARGFLELGPVDYRETTPRLPASFVFLTRCASASRKMRS